MAIDPEELTQFTWIDTDELHLVGISANGVPEPLLAKTADVGRIIKSNDEDRFLLMVAYSPHQMPLRGKDGRTDLASPKVLEKAAWLFMAKGGKTGMWHEPGHEGEAIVVENGIHRGPSWDVHGDGSLVIKAGDWLVGLILSPAAWSLYKQGKISGVSLQGSAGRKPATQKAIARSTGRKPMKASKILKQMEKAARQQYPSTSSPHVTGVNLAGAASTIGKPGTAERVVQSFLSGLEDRVRKAQGDAAMAETAMAKEGARQGLRIALRQRLLGKLVIKTAVEANQGPSQFGRPIFQQGSTYNLADDDGLGYVGHGGEAVR